MIELARFVIATTWAFSTSIRGCVDRRDERVRLTERGAGAQNARWTQGPPTAAIVRAVVMGGFAAGA